MDTTESPDIIEAQVRPADHRRHDAQSIMPENCLAIESKRKDEVGIDNTVASEEEQDCVDSDICYAVFPAAIEEDMLAHLACIEGMKNVSDYPKPQDHKEYLATPDAEQWSSAMGE